MARRPGRRLWILTTPVSGLNMMPSAERTSAKLVERDNASSLHVALVHGCWPPVASFGGIVRYVVTLASGLRDRGHNVTVVTCGTARDLTRDVEDGILVVRVPPVRDGHSRLVRLLAPLVLSGRYARALSMVDREHPIDVVEFSNWAGEGFVHSLHGPRPHVIRVATMGWQSRAMADAAPRTRYAAITDRWRDWTEALPIRRSDLVLVPSRAHGDVVARRLELKHPPLVMALGDGQRSAVGDQARPHSGNLLFVGKMEPRKGFDTLVEAFALACPSLPDDTRLTVAGEDSRAGSASFQDAVLGRLSGRVRDRIDVLGWVSDARLADLYQSCLLVVAPSRYESFGLPFIEAMRHGKAVIGTTAGGIPDVVEQGTEGFLVGPEDAAGLAETIVRLVTDDAARLRLERAGRSRYEREFTQDAFARRSETAYRRAIGARNRPGVNRREHISYAGTADHGPL